MQKERILFLSPRIPWPLDTGGKIRTYYILRSLARHHKITLLTIGDFRKESAGIEAIEQLGVQCEVHPQEALLNRIFQLAIGLAGPIPYNIFKYQNRSMQKHVQSLALQGMKTIVHCDHLHMAPYGYMSGLPFVIDEHNIESIIWERFAQEKDEPLYKRLLFRQQGYWLKKIERRLCQQASMVLLVSENDRQNLMRIVEGQEPPMKVVPNGVDVEYFQKRVPPVAGGHIFFTGSMDWAPNENAVLSFLDETWPAIHARNPELKFFVVGRNPSDRLKARNGQKNVVVTGTVPDVRPYMQNALALVVPMRVGGGTRLKILEAFSAKVPVISTQVGIEGIAATPNTHYLQAESTADFVGQVESLKSNMLLKASIAQAAATLAKENYSWDAIGDDLAQTYQKSLFLASRRNVRGSRITKLGSTTFNNLLGTLMNEAPESTGTLG